MSERQTPPQPQHPARASPTRPTAPSASPTAPTPAPASGTAPRILFHRGGVPVVFRQSPSSAPPGPHSAACPLHVHHGHPPHGHSHAHHPHRPAQPHMPPTSRPQPPRSASASSLPPPAPKQRSATILKMSPILLVDHGNDGATISWEHPDPQNNGQWEFSVEVRSHFATERKLPEFVALTSDACTMSFGPMKETETSTVISPSSPASPSSLSSSTVASSAPNGTTVRKERLLCTAKLCFHIRPGREHHIRVRALLAKSSNKSTGDAVGQASNVVMFTSKPAAPDAPLSMELTSRTKNTLTLKWPPVDHNGDALSAYELWGCDVSDCDNKNDAVVADEDRYPLDKFVLIWTGLATSQKVKEIGLSSGGGEGKEGEEGGVRLRPCGTYAFRLRASNSLGWGPFGVVSAFTTFAAAPDAPLAPRITACDAHSIVFEWDPAWDNGARITLYEVQMKRHHIDELSGSDKKAKKKSSGSASLSSVSLSGAHMSYESWEIVYVGSDLHGRVDRLPRCTSYQLRVRATNQRGVGPWCQPVSLASTTREAPGEPRRLGLVGDARVGEIDVGWEAPRDLGGFEEEEDSKGSGDQGGHKPTLWYVLQSDDAAGGEFVNVYTGSNTQCAVERLTPGRTYRFRVACALSPTAQLGKWSAIAECASLATAPLAPSGVALVEISASSMKIVWDAPVLDPLAPVTSYHVVFMDRVSEETLFEDTIPASKALVSFEVNELCAAHTYGAMMAACNSTGEGPMSPLVEARTSPAAPEEPHELALVSAATASSAVLTWSVPYDNGSPVSDYRCVVTPHEKSFTVEMVHEPVPQVTLSGLAPATEYSVCVHAINNYGTSVASEPLVFRSDVSAPGAIDHLRVVSRDETSLEFEWSAPAHDGGSPVRRYLLHVSPAPADGATELAVFEARAQLDGLIAATSYTVRVEAENERGLGPRSGRVVARTLAPRPARAQVEVQRVTHSSARLSWSMEANGTGGGEALSYEVFVAKSGERRPRSVYDGVERQCTVGELQPRTVYGLCIVAIGERGRGEPSVAEFVTAPVPLPAVAQAPTYVRKARVVRWRLSKKDASVHMQYCVTRQRRHGWTHVVRDVTTDEPLTRMDVHRVWEVEREREGTAVVQELSGEVSECALDGTDEEVEGTRWRVRVIEVATTRKWMVVGREDGTGRGEKKAEEEGEEEEEPEEEEAESCEKGEWIVEGRAERREGPWSDACVVTAAVAEPAEKAVAAVKMERLPETHEEVAPAPVMTPVPASQRPLKQSASPVDSEKEADGNGLVVALVALAVFVALVAAFVQLL